MQEEDRFFLESGLSCDCVAAFLCLSDDFTIGESYVIIIGSFDAYK